MKLKATAVILMFGATAFAQDSYMTFQVKVPEFAITKYQDYESKSSTDAAFHYYASVCVPKVTLDQRIETDCSLVRFKHVISSVTHYSASDTKLSTHSASCAWELCRLGNGSVAWRPGK